MILSLLSGDILLSINRQLKARSLQILPDDVQELLKNKFLSLKNNIII